MQQEFTEMNSGRVAGERSAYQEVPARYGAQGSVMPKKNGANEIKPFFLESTGLERVVMYASVGANLAVIAFCMTWIILNWGAADLSAWAIATALLVGYFLADIASGAVHWANDTWFSERGFLGRRIAIAREHHTHPHHILGYSFLEHATVGSAPSALFIGPTAVLTALLPASGISAGFMIVYLVMSVCLFFGTSLHNLGHRQGKFALTRLAQRYRLVLSPEHHGLHHCGDHNGHYCTVNGWANYPLDHLRVWRWLENRIQRATGATPRENDLAWRRRFGRPTD